MASATFGVASVVLQQCLPLAVLKHVDNIRLIRVTADMVATVLTACGIETWASNGHYFTITAGCNSAYRLRY